MEYKKCLLWWDIYYFLMEKLSRIYMSLLFNLSYMFYRTSVKIITILFLELVHIVKVNPNTTYIHIHKQQTTVYCMFFFLCIFGIIWNATFCNLLSWAHNYHFEIYSCHCMWYSITGTYPSLFMLLWVDIYITYPFTIIDGVALLLSTDAHVHTSESRLARSQARAHLASGRWGTALQRVSVLPLPAIELSPL